MAKVGNIMARHNGANVAVADIYDQKQAVSIPVADTENCICCLHFNPSEGIVDEGLNTTWTVNDSTGYEITSTGSKFDYAYTVLNSDTHLQAANPAVFKIDNNGCTIDGYFYIGSDVLNANNAKTGLFYFGTSSYSSSAIALGGHVSRLSDTKLLFNVVHGRGKSGSTYYTVSFYFEIDHADVLDRVFHFAYVYSPNNDITRRFFLDGVLKRTVLKTSDTYTNKQFTPTIAMIAGSTSQLYLHNRAGLACSMFRFHNAVLWTDNFTPPNEVSTRTYIDVQPSGNIPIRHNNTTYYAPLITTANKPCIAVRHNNQTFYTVRS